MSSVARRYARALFDLAKEQGAIEAVGRELLAATAQLEIPELAEVVASPRLSSERRHALVDALAQQLSLSQTTATFLLLLADKQRLQEIGAIARRFQDLEDDALGRVRMTVRSAVPLTQTQVDEVAAVFGKQLQRTVIARAEVDPSLLGGIVVETEGKVYDGSVRSNLERLAKHMAHPDSQ